MRCWRRGWRWSDSDERRRAGQRNFSSVGPLQQSESAGRNHTASTSPARVPEPGGAVVARSGVLESGAPLSVTGDGETGIRPCNTKLPTTDTTLTESNTNARAGTTPSGAGTTAIGTSNTALRTSNTNFGANNTALRAGGTALRSGITALGATVLLAENAMTPQPNVVMPLRSAVTPLCLSVMPLRLPAMPRCQAARPAARTDQFGADACCHFVPPSMVLKTPRKVPA